MLDNSDDAVATKFTQKVQQPIGKISRSYTFLILTFLAADGKTIN